MSTGGHAAATRLSNLYVRRELRELPADEWDDFVLALWTLKNVSTVERRGRFLCPSGKQTDYHEHDY